MPSRARFAFLLLILAQAVHSVEECYFQLYAVFAPARFVSGLLSDDMETGFVIANVAVVLFGLVCYVVWVRPGRPSARAWAWGWVVLEVGNALSHVGFTLGRGAYLPGVATAPLLLAGALYLVYQLRGPRRLKIEESKRG